MVFSSPTFLWLFLPAVVTINFIFRKNKCISNLFLVLSSLLFYAWGEPVYVLLMLFSIFVNWGFGILVGNMVGRARQIFLAADVVINLALLGYFKYFDFLISTINGVAGRQVFALKQIALPIGISFFTFQAMSYVIDVYRENCKIQRNVVNLALYISFFPQLIAGPIVRYHDIETQIENRVITLEGFSLGLRRFLYGLGKKVIIANCMAKTADTVFSMTVSDLSFLFVWVGAITYTIQLYYDFSGYSDMAIGLGRIFGFTFLENFNYPYLSTSIRDLWKRWHISLGSWFREYVYIPLGGSKKGRLRGFINLIIVFFLTGLWHGANWTFVVWGLYNAFFLIIERFKFGKLLEKIGILRYVYANIVFITGCVIFRADTIGYAIECFKRMVNPWAYPYFITYVSIYDLLPLKSLVVMICGILGGGVIQQILIRFPEKIKGSQIVKASELIFLCFVFYYSMMQLVAGGYNPFIYFRF